MPNTMYCLHEIAAYIYWYYYIVDLLCNFSAVLLEGINTTLYAVRHLSLPSNFVNLVFAWSIVLDTKPTDWTVKFNVFFTSIFQHKILFLIHTIIISRLFLT